MKLQQKVRIKKIQVIQYYVANNNFVWLEDWLEPINEESEHTVFVSDPNLPINTMY